MDMLKGLNIWVENRGIFPDTINYSFISFVLKQNLVIIPLLLCDDIIYMKCLITNLSIGHQHHSHEVQLGTVSDITLMWSPTARLIDFSLYNN